MENQDMSLKDALLHLEVTNRKIPLIRIGSLITVDEMELLMENVSDSDRKAFKAVVISLNNGELRLLSFLKENNSRSFESKFEGILKNDGIKSGEVILPSVLSTSNSLMRTNMLMKFEQDSEMIRKNNLKKTECIPINIWDDYYDDGCVPEDKKQETYIYVEDTDMSHQKHKECLEILLDYINKNLNTGGIKLWLEYYESKKRYPELIGTEYEVIFFNRWEIKLVGLTHERLDDWMCVLENVDIKIDDIPFCIYSES